MSRSGSGTGSQVTTPGDWKATLPGAAGARLSREYPLSAGESYTAAGMAVWARTRNTLPHGPWVTVESQVVGARAV